MPQLHRPFTKTKQTSKSNQTAPSEPTRKPLLPDNPNRLMSIVCSRNRATDMHGPHEYVICQPRINSSKAQKLKDSKTFKNTFCDPQKKKLYRRAPPPATATQAAPPQVARNRRSFPESELLGPAILQRLRRGSPLSGSIARFGGLLLGGFLGIVCGFRSQTAEVARELQAIPSQRQQLQP